MTAGWKSPGSALRGERVTKKVSTRLTPLTLLERVVVGELGRIIPPVRYDTIAIRLNREPDDVEWSTLTRWEVKSVSASSSSSRQEMKPTLDPLRVPLIHCKLDRRIPHDLAVDIQITTLHPYGPVLFQVEQEACNEKFAASIRHRVLNFTKR